jgi:hypothetical protein
MQLSMTIASGFRKTEAQVFGDYLLLWIWPNLVWEVTMALSCHSAWKQGSITLSPIPP